MPSKPSSKRPHPKMLPGKLQGGNYPTATLGCTPSAPHSTAGRVDATTKVWVDTANIPAGAKRIAVLGGGGWRGLPGPPRLPACVPPAGRAQANASRVEAPARWPGLAVVAWTAIAPCTEKVPGNTDRQRRQCASERDRACCSHACSCCALSRGVIAGPQLLLRCSRSLSAW